MDRAEAKRIASAIDKALEPVALAHGLQIVVKGGRFSTTTCTAKVECSELDRDGVAQTGQRIDFLAVCDAYGLKSEHLDAAFQVRGETYRITGLSPNRRRYPVSAVRVRDGKAYKFAADTVVHALAEEKGA